MSYVKTYATNDDVSAHLPFTLNDTSKPSKEAVEVFRMQVYTLINERLGGVVADEGGLRMLELNKVLLLIDNYYARGRGDPTDPVIITDADMTSLRLNADDVTSGWGYGGGHYSVDIPG